MINIDKWNRKDLDPKQTVETIKKILKENNIETHIIDRKQYSDLWASSRIEIDSLSGIGANGKGVGMDYTMASAYGELIERLQSGSLLNSLFQIRDNLKYGDEVDYSRGAELLRKYFSDATSKYTDEQLIHMLESYPQMMELANYYDMDTLEYVEIPERFLGFICGTNGIAAGNTYEEAFCQGLCEVFERYVMKEIYSLKNIIWYTIPRTLYIHTNSMKLIEEIEKKGYRCVVKNCTLNGLLPVIGVLIIDSTKTKYLFRLGSDLCLDLAIQRCITEIFQGISFDTTFRLQMKSIFSEDNNMSIWNYSNPTEGVTRAITSGSGVIPYSLFSSKELYDLTPFDMDCTTNRSTLEKLLLIFKKTKKKLFIRDYSFLGFPTIRIFVPNMSDAYYYKNNMDYISVLESIGKLGDTLKKNEVNNIKSKKIFNSLKTIREYQTFKYNTTLNKFTGIVLSDQYPPEVQNIDYVLGLLALSIGEYAEAKKYISDAYKVDSYIKNNKYLFASLIVEAIQNSMNICETKEVFSVLQVSKEIFELIDVLYKAHNSGYNVFTCLNCSECYLAEKCSYEYWKELTLKLRKKQDEFDKKQPAIGFFQNISTYINTNR